MNLTSFDNYSRADKLLKRLTKIVSGEQELVRVK